MCSSTASPGRGFMPIFASLLLLSSTTSTASFRHDASSVAPLLKVPGALATGSGILDAGVLASRRSLAAKSV
jgi:hypothetical protein